MHKNKVHHDGNWLNQKYWDEKFNQYEIAKLCNVTQTTIGRWFKKYGIKARTNSEAIKLHRLKNPNFRNRENHPLWGKRGEDAGHWKGGKRHLDSGYINIYQPNHPHAYGNHYIREHRLVMEQYLGRYLEPNELVHHKDGNKTNNNISNLYLTTRKKHKMGYGEAYQEGFAAALLLCLMANKYRAI